MTNTLSEANREDVEALIQTIEAEGWRVSDYSVQGAIQLDVSLELVQQ